MGCATRDLAPAVQSKQARETKEACVLSVRADRQGNEAAGSGPPPPPRAPSMCERSVYPSA
eukprot:209334-Hanusia_phi.AAC.1